MLEKLLEGLSFANILRQVFHKNGKDLNLSITWKRTLHKLLENPGSREIIENALVEAILEEAKSKKIET